MQNYPAIVFYDGDCGFCNHVVAFILKNEKNRSIYFASLQSNFSKETLSKLGIKTINYDTFYFSDKGNLYERSTAALRLVPYLKWYFFPIYIGYVFPSCIRDAIYNFIARRRKSLAKDYCFLPSKEDGPRFIA